MIRQHLIPLRGAHSHSTLHISTINRNHLAAFDPRPSFRRSRSLLLSKTSRVHYSKIPNASPLQYQWVEGVEDLETYHPGGYHPTHIGDRYQDGRYEIIHKLGFGSYSTTWLAKDHQENRSVALKIIVASASRESIEAKVLRAISAGKQDHPGRRYVMSFLDEFTTTGPNGDHLCIVSEAMGCSVARSKDETMPWKFPSNTARAISAQVLLGLDYIHSCGVVHGDLHSSNILFRLSNHQSTSIDEYYSRFGEPQKFPVQRLDGHPAGPEAPNYCVPPARTFQPCGEVNDDVQVVIADFGEAFFPAEPPTQLHTPILLLPPEFLFNERLGPPIDVWTLGCTLYNLLGKRSLFEGFMPDEYHAIAEMISTLGNLPSRWWDRWQKKEDFFLEDGTWDPDTHRAHAPWSRPLRERMGLMGREGEFSPEEMASLAKMLRAMLAYEPGERITTKDVVKSEWMRKWGLPAIKH